MKRIVIATTIAMAAMSVSARNFLQVPYPQAPTDNTVDEYFGIKVSDPYRPLENDTAAATLRWVEQENALTQGYLAQIPMRDAIHHRIASLMNYTRYGLPSREKDGYYYFSENDGLQNQSVIYRAKTLDGPREVFLDPNKLSDDGTVALKGLYMSPSGKYTAYAVSRSGSDWTEFYVMDTATGELLDDHIEWSKFSGAAWQGDEGFYYSAYARPESGKEFSNANEYHKVYFHKLGTPQTDDVVAYENREQPLYFHDAETSDDGTALFIQASGQGIGNMLMVKDLRTPDGQWQVIEPSQDYVSQIVDVRDGMVYMLTTIDAPLYRLVSFPLKSAADRKKWRTVIPEKKNVVAGIYPAGNNFLVVYDEDASNHVYQYTRKGKLTREVPLPGYGTVSISASPENDEVFYWFTSFTTPGDIYSYDMRKGTSELIRRAEVDTADYVTEQVFYPSTDGTMIPMFITYKRGLERDGNNPVYMYGYGGFNISLNPSFAAQRLLWLENGGIYAQANLRGGNEYGEPWHEAGTKMQKLNVFNDFISAAEYMINQGWTKPELLVCEGGSNGGLLVGACVNMRPDLYKVAIPRVGVMDMLRYHLFTIGWNWASDYGTSADSPEMAQYLRNYSPMHNISNDGTPYPAIMVTTADHDDRVVPAHSFKYAAALQAADTGSAPKLIRIDSKAGHGAGKPIGKVIDEWTDIYSFIFYNLGITPETAK